MTAAPGRPSCRERTPRRTGRRPRRRAVGRCRCAASAGARRCPAGPGRSRPGGAAPRRGRCARRTPGPGSAACDPIRGGRHDPILSARHLAPWVGEQVRCACQASRATASSITSSRLQNANRTNGLPSPGRRRTPPAAPRPPGPVREIQAERACRRSAERPDVGHHEVGALRPQHPEARRRPARRTAGPAWPADPSRSPATQADLGLQRQRHRRLERRPTDEGEELLGRPHRGDQRRRSAGPADLPAGGAECLSGAGDGEGPLGHPGQRGDRACSTPSKVRYS